MTKDAEKNIQDVEHELKQDRDRLDELENEIVEAERKRPPKPGPDYGEKKSGVF